MTRPKGTGSAYQRADGRWVAVIETGYTPTGGRRRSTRLAKNEDHAKRLLRDMLREHNATITASNEPRLTVKTWADRWLEQHRQHVRDKTYQTDKGKILKWVVPTIGHRRLADLTAGDVRSVSQAVRDAGLTPRMAAAVHAKLVQMLTDAVRDGHHVPEAARLTKAGPQGTSDRDAIPVPDAIRILDVASRRDDYPRWVAALLQGMRQSEVLGLTWQAVDFDRSIIMVRWQLQELSPVERGNPSKGYHTPPGQQTIHLTGPWHLTPPKTNAGYRVIPMVPWMHTALLAWRSKAPANPWGLVWSSVDDSRGTARPMPIRHRHDREAWAQLQKEANVSHPSGRLYTLHEARHTTATILLELGVDPKVLTTLMGHSSILTTRGYQHVRTDLSLVALEGVAARLSLGTSGDSTVVRGEVVGTVGE